MLLQQVKIIEVVASFRLGVHRAPFGIDIGKPENLVPISPFAAALVISLRAVGITVDMAVILNRFCSQTAELSQNVRTGSIALLAIYQQRAVFLVDMQVPCFTAQGTGSGNMSARLCFYTG